MNVSKVLGLIAVLSVATVAASAQGLGSSQPLICASMEAYDCGPGSDCVRGTVDSVDVPRFIRVDFVKMVAHATRPGGEERTAKIESMTREEGKLILQGVQLGLGWSMVITQESGAMVLTAAGEQVAFVIFGACTPL